MLLTKNEKAFTKTILAKKIKRLEEAAKQDIPAILKLKKTSLEGLSWPESSKRLLGYGKNEILTKKSDSRLLQFAKNFKDPLSLLLLILAIISFITHDIKGAYLISGMVFLSIILRFIQEARADSAVAKLKSMIHTTILVIRKNKPKEIPTKNLVPGDIIRLAAGDMIPADIRLIESKDLFVNQSVLTGESLPVEKHAEIDNKEEKSFLDYFNLCFLGTSVESGTATAVVLATGKYTYFGSIAEDIIKQQKEVTSFDLGIKKFTWLIIRIIIILAPLVFLLNGISKGNWLEAFLFALAITVGLTPELLPMIVTVNLSKGALEMCRKKVIIKRLSAIQNFGAMDILCTDKTGTLTQGKIVLEKHLNILGETNEKVLSCAYLNSFFQTGLNNLMDNSILHHKELNLELKIENYKKIDEIPFDFARRRMSVVVEGKNNERLFICKGAIENILDLCLEV